jgi:hypothetical protein
MRVYGAPKGYDITTQSFDNSALPQGWLTELTPSPKIYGASSHHPGESGHNTCMYLPRSSHRTDVSCWQLSGARV